MNSKVRNSTHSPSGWSHFAHGSTGAIGLRGEGSTREQALERAALALTGVSVHPARVRPEIPVRIECLAPDDETLLVDWINALVYEMTTRGMVFGRFDVRLAGHALEADAWGEHVDLVRHEPAAQVRGATCEDVRLHKSSGNSQQQQYWIAECIVDL